MSSLKWPLTPRIIPVPVGQTTVQCINIGNKSGRGCNGRYHQVERVLNIPTSTVLGMIQESPRFTVFSRLLTVIYQIDLKEKDLNCNL